DQADATGRFSFWQELSLPFSLGPFRLVPYAQLELAEYTRDLAGDERGRVWGAGGLRGSLPLTRLYPDVQSELFNVQGINHKITPAGNYFTAASNEPYSRSPQLDRINDDVTDQAMRDFRPFQPLYNPANGFYLATGTNSSITPYVPIFDPQNYAFRRLVEN